MPSVSVLIVARNAAATLGEALGSALGGAVDEVVVVDDCSEDGTGDVARGWGDGRVRVVGLEKRRTLGYARQRGLEAVRGELCFLLDADDAFLPGRVERLTGVLGESGADFVADELELVDGVSGRFLRRLEIPGFLDRAPGLARLFERNFLPGIGQIGFKVEGMRRLGYDVGLHGVEDSDLVLRALLAGARGELVREAGYRMRHFAGSVSRNRDRQGAELARALGKHDAGAVRRLLERGGMGGRLVDWALLSLAVFRRDLAGARALLEGLGRSVKDREEVLELDGPWPYEEGWRLDFERGTLELLDGGAGAVWLERAAGRRRLPEVLNNWGVALFRLGDGAGARALWEEALGMLPGYADARENLAGGREGERVTALPLRREASRSEY